MFLLQAETNVTTDWFGPFVYSTLVSFIFLTIGLVVLYFLIRAGVRAGTKDLQKQSTIANQLYAEDLRMKGVSEARIHEILHSK